MGWTKCETKRLVLAKEGRYGDLKRVMEVGRCWHGWLSNRNDLEKKSNTHLDRSTIKLSRQGKASEKKGNTKARSVYGQTKKERDKEEEGRKRHGLCDRAAKKILALSQKRHSDGPRNH